MPDSSEVIAAFEERRSLHRASLASAIAEPDRIDAAMAHLEDYDLIADAEQRVDFLVALGRRAPDELAVLAWVIDHARAGQALEAGHVLDLIADPSYRHAYGEAAGDARLVDAGPAELASWARIRWAAGSERFEQLVQRRRVDG